MEDFRLELKEEFKTFVLTQEQMIVERIRFQFTGWERIPYVVKEKYDYQDFKEVILKKETLNHQPKNSKHKFVYSLTILAKEKITKNTNKFVFKNMKIDSKLRNNINEFITEQECFEPFANAVLERIKDYPQVKVFVYETVKVKILNKVNQVFPPLYIGSAVLGGVFLLKLLTAFMKISVKLSLFYLLDSVIMNIGAIFTLLGMGGAYFINRHIKQNAQISLDSQQPLLFFSEIKQSEDEEKEDEESKDEQK
jgi:hypothetical protein